MTEEEIDALHNAYRKARKAYCEWDAKREKIGKDLASIARMIDPEWTGSYKPEKKALSDKQIESVLAIPSPKTIVETTSEWSAAQSALLEIWEQIPSEERKHCQDLPDGIRYFRVRRP